MVGRWWRTFWEFIGLMADGYARESFLTAHAYECSQCRSRIIKGAKQCHCCKIGLTWPWETDESTE